MERSFQFVSGEYYHVFNRGVEKRSIFLEAADWRRFQHLLYLSNSRKPLVFKQIQGDPLDWEREEALGSVLAYTLMPNHFHLVVRENTEGGISKLLSKLTTAYSMYFNTKYERSGPLMCRPFKARHIDDDQYFRWVLSYVHLNPVGTRPDPAALLRSYRYSSYYDYYVGERKESRIVDMSSLPFDRAKLENVESMLNTCEEFQGDPLE